MQIQLLILQLLAMGLLAYPMNMHWEGGRQERDLSSTVDTIVKTPLRLLLAGPIAHLQMAAEFVGAMGTFTKQTLQNMVSAGSHLVTAGTDMLISLPAHIGNAASQALTVATDAAAKLVESSTALVKNFGLTVDSVGHQLLSR